MGGGQGLHRSIVVATYMFRLAGQRQGQGAFLAQSRWMITVNLVRWQA